ncbi:MAG TPA: hypothetical protein VGD31_07240 [Sphingobacteriaceae bacterium]
MKIPDLDVLSEDPRDNREGSWFGRILVSGRGRCCLSLYDRIQGDTRLADRFFELNDTGQVQLKEQEMRSYLSDAEAMREYLIVAYHLTCGMVGRATEVVSLTYANSGNV